LQLVGTTTLDLGDIGEMPLITALGSALLDLEVNGDTLMAGQSAERSLNRADGVPKHAASSISQHADG
jgi:hypothetical protein